MRLSLDFCGSVPKYSDARNEDATAFSRKAEVFAIADGASESYAGADWSRILVENSIESRRVQLGRLLKASITTYRQAVEPDGASWSRQAAFERGSFSTLLHVARRQDKIAVTALGDSLAVAGCIGGDWESMPYQDPEEFDQRPLLISDRMELNSVVTSPQHLRQRRTRWPMLPGLVVLLMTDALGRWSLDKGLGRDAIHRLVEITSAGELEEFVVEQRAIGDLRRDDTTLMRLRVDLA